MKCPKCNSELRTVEVNIEGAATKALTKQCTKCEYVEFEKDSTKKILSELKNQPLKIKHKIIKLSDNRLGMYFNKNIIESLKLKPGENFSVIVPDKKHIVLCLKD